MSMPKAPIVSPETRQVSDDPALFEELLRREGAASDLYRPTNYWGSYAQAFIPELRRLGLHDFRRRKNSIVDAFGASDHVPACTVDWSLPSLRWLQKLAQTRVFWRLARPARNAAERAVARVAAPPYSFEASMVYFHMLVAKKFERRGVDLGMLGTDYVGNPDGLVTIDGAFWSWTQLNCASLLGDALSYIDLDDINTVVELGGGLGRNILMLAKLRPAATILCFDIMPQVYVANQYLKAVMPDRVVSIDTGVHLDFADGDISSIKGKIAVLPAWKMPECQKIAIDLFWNAASFQEMEPDVVRNYLMLVKHMAPRWISIMAMPGGNYWGEWKPGRGGTKQPVVNSIYFDALAPEYACTSDELADLFLRALDHRLWIFAKRELACRARSPTVEGTA
jgi:putative sugar O-methyltransferase